MNTTVNIIGVLYGITLVLAAFIRGNRILESMRVDGLVMPNPTEGSRPVNLLLGLLVAGYAAYSLLKG
ncbi:hypothetical protein [Trichlorobacter ammonificans]|uniref:Uncharacterized protein n=1 Tax=Trichlorobacter ammonificans TaxID=2916410 RepID=A0ABN8HJX6_9BACT|nr:hypothetical protein [Trichlorobacter ammonificans]CAH2031499.1 conserved protein of unknown function [Trichlorobacter ammonificans]